MSRNRQNKDYYAILGLTEAATEPEIRKAYRKLALEWHPDRNQGRPEATERFKEISEAYGVLSDPAKRQQYDQARRSGQEDTFRYTQDDILRDLFRNPGAAAMFEELFRELERNGVRVDRQYFHHILFGGRVRVSGGVFVISPFGAAASLFRLVGGVLRAAGVIPPAQRRPLPWTRSKLISGIAQVGRWLLGKGQRESADVTQPLPLTSEDASRGGSRPITIQTGDRPEQVLLTIPAGVKAGTRLRLRGKGRSLPDGSRGDLYLVVEVR